MDINSNNQWFVGLTVAIKDKQADIEFKVDTGCNCLLISHSTLKNLGISTSQTAIAKLPDTVGLSVSEKIQLKQIGKISLFYGDTHIGDFDAYCHATRETHDLLGATVFQAFIGAHFDLIKDNSTLTFIMA